MPIDRFSSDDQMTTIIVDADHDQPDQTVSLSITDTGSLNVGHVLPLWVSRANNDAVSAVSIRFKVRDAGSSADQNENESVEYSVVLGSLEAFEPPQPQPSQPSLPVIPGPVPIDWSVHEPAGVLLNGRADDRQWLKGNEGAADRFETLYKFGGQAVDDADVIFGFESTDQIVGYLRSDGDSTMPADDNLIPLVRFDQSRDLDGDGQLDTIIMASNGGACVILDDYVVTPATTAPLVAVMTFGGQQIAGLTAAEFSTTAGSAPQANILVGATGSVDKFEIDIITEIGVGNADIIHRFDKAGGDKIKLVATGGAPAFNGVIHFDSNADWNGDGTKDTILHMNGHALAIIHGQSITNWAADDFEDGTVTGVSELDFTTLPDIS